MENLTRVFKTGWTGGNNTECGAGSDPEFVAGTFGPWLDDILVRYKIKTVTDAGCGDCAWMREVPGIGASITYFGYDVVLRPGLDTFAAKRPKVRYSRQSVSDFTPPRHDLIICRDVFIHLPNDMVIEALKRFKTSRSLFLLSDLTQTANNDNRKTKPEKKADRLRLDEAPFNLGKPIETQWELGLWRL